MKKSKKYFLLFFAMLLFVVSCYNDKGNSGYKNIPVIEIDTLVTPLRVTCSQNSALVINPKILNYNESELTFKWTLRNTKYGSNTYESTVIGESKDLNYKITETPGEYYLYYEITDTKTNTVSFTNYRLLVLSFAQQGMMILHGDEMSSEVSILANDRVNPDWDGEILQHNVFSTTNGNRIEGIAKGVKYLLMTHSVYVFTDKGGYHTSGNALEIINPYKDMFMNALSPDQIDYRAYDVNGYNEFIINGKDVYWCSQGSANSHKKFDVSLYGADFEAAPYFGSHESNWKFYGMIYDQLNHRFLGVKYGGIVGETADVTPQGGFNMRKVGKDMLYAELGFEKRWYCVMQDLGATGAIKAKHLYVCNLNINNDAAGEAVYPMTNAKDIKDAVYYAFGSRGNVMYYSTKDKIYTFRYKENNTPSELLIDVAVGYPSYEITLMEIYKNRLANFSLLDSRTLFVALYDKTTKEGKLLSFEINEATGAIDSQSKKEYSGFGKITGINYKQK